MARGGKRSVSNRQVIRVQCTSCSRSEVVAIDLAKDRSCGSCGHSMRLVDPATGAWLPNDTQPLPVGLKRRR